MSLLVYETPLDAAHACARRVLEILEEAVTGSRDATFAISGGSTPKLMFAALAAAGFDWGHVHLFWVDERAVPPADDQSNYKLAKASLIDVAKIPSRNVHRVYGELDPDGAAHRYRDDLREYFGLPKDGLPAFDVIHCGMGPDAHTASLFPEDPFTEDRNGLAASVFAPKLPHWRVTLLPGVLLNARNTLMLVTGADKADTLHTVMNGEYDAFRLPVQIFHKEGKNVAWFLDRAAATRVAA
jgi:6-phosphogluconolactonase